MKRFTYGSLNTSPRYWSSCGQLSSSCANVINIGGSLGLTRSVSKPIACKLGGGKAPRLSEVHCDRDSVCVKTDT